MVAVAAAAVALVATGCRNGRDESMDMDEPRVAFSGFGDERGAHRALHRDGDARKRTQCEVRQRMRGLSFGRCSAALWDRILPSLDRADTEPGRCRSSLVRCFTKVAFDSHACASTQRAEFCDVVA